MDESDLTDRTNSDSMIVWIWLIALASAVIVGVVFRIVS
jgi:hypothetical protein